MKEDIGKTLFDIKRQGIRLKGCEVMKEDAGMTLFDSQVGRL